MSKISKEFMQKAISDMLAERKNKKFVETVELQVVLRDYDPEKEKRFVGAVKLPNCPHPNMKVAVIGTAAHCDQAKQEGIPCIDVEGMKRFNKDKKQIKKWAKQYDQLIASESLMKQIPRLLGNTLTKIGMFPQPVGESEVIKLKVQEVRGLIKWQLKKVLTLGNGVGTVDMDEEQIRQNIAMSINFLVSLLKKGWHNIKTLHIKTTQSKSIRIYG
ncbi:putative ribosomal protein L1 [Pseudocohnilembus persalinus]|uniref:Putative ribosomal protein L1 n=1 Tax=Pseudocohnilembus persalinus TaxID=266149 RepID=A0A0V0R927_PSEPJ|nr:putative ribosomal protein L1 [Pseudocohnilembus persalinus]|eukprot:KRX10969.1 putative ribosomal protein L1 [Pseudocohnilembus persalinus]